MNIKTNKKGQLSMIILLGVVLLVGIILFFTIQSKTTVENTESQISQQDISIVQSTLATCVDKAMQQCYTTSTALNECTKEKTYTCLPQGIEVDLQTLQITKSTGDFAVYLESTINAQIQDTEFTSKQQVKIPLLYTEELPLDENGIVTETRYISDSANQLLIEIPQGTQVTGAQNITLSFTDNAAYSIQSGFAQTIHMQPSGATFNPPLVLTVPTSVLTTDFENPIVVQTQGNKIIDTYTTTVENNIITAQISHFSDLNIVEDLPNLQIRSGKETFDIIDLDDFFEPDNDSINISYEYLGSNDESIAWCELDPQNEVDCIGVSLGNATMTIKATTNTSESETKTFVVTVLPPCEEIIYSTEDYVICDSVGYNQADNNCYTDDQGTIATNQECVYAQNNRPLYWRSISETGKNDYCGSFKALTNQCCNTDGSIGEMIEGNEGFYAKHDKLSCYKKFTKEEPLECDTMPDFMTTTQYQTFTELGCTMEQTLNTSICYATADTTTPVNSKCEAEDKVRLIWKHIISESVAKSRTVNVHDSCGKSTITNNQCCNTDGTIGDSDIGSYQDDGSFYYHAYNEEIDCYFPFNGVEINNTNTTNSTNTTTQTCDDIVYSTNTSYQAPCNDTIYTLADNNCYIDEDGSSTTDTTCIFESNTDSVPLFWNHAESSGTNDNCGALNSDSNCCNDYGVISGYMNLTVGYKQQLHSKDVCYHKFEKSCSTDEHFVCGENNITYRNECVANENGITVAYTGECEEPTDTCTTDLEFVCGEDRVTYINECHAIQAGTTVLYDRACTSEDRTETVCGSDGTHANMSELIAAEDTFLYIGACDSDFNTDYEDAEYCETDSDCTCGFDPTNSDNCVVANIYTTFTDKTGCYNLCYNIAVDDETIFCNDNNQCDAN